MRRTITFISAFALLISMLALPAAVADDLNTSQAAETCPDGVDGWVKIDSSSGSASGDWGSFNYDSDSLHYAVSLGGSLDICVKPGGKEVFYYLGLTGDGTLDIKAQQGTGISHVSWRATFTPPVFPAGALGVEKTAAGAYDRTVTWDITKSVDPDYHRLLVGDSAVSDYEVDVEKTAVSHNYTISGSILISWTGSTAPVTITGIEDSIDGAVITCPANWDKTILPGSSITCHYSAPGHPDVTENTVDVDGEYVIPAGFQDAGDTVPVDSSDTSGPFGYAETLIGFDTVTVVDRFDNGPVRTMGTISDDRLFEYSRTFTCSERGTFTYPDRAAIVETRQFDDALVTVECVAALEACTPGFWGGTSTSPYTPANQPAWDYLELDPMVDTFAGKTYNEIFNTRGRNNYSGSLIWHAAAAYLNALMADAGQLDFPLTPQDVLDLYEEGDKEALANANEDGDCPFGADFSFMTE